MGKTVNGKVAELFAHWDEAMIWSCLQGHMGTITCDDEKGPTSAMADVGDICFFTGNPNVNLLKKFSGNKLLVPRDDGWDAHDLRSVALAEKLGYHMDHPYVTYELF